MTNADSLRTKALQFLEQLKDGVTVRYNNIEVEYVLDPLPSFDMLVKRINNTIVVNVYTSNVRCTIRIFVDKNGEWRPRSIICRR